MAGTRENTYRSKLFDRQIKALHRADKKGVSAAERAEKLICDISHGAISEAELLTKKTKNGELRLNNCLKFDLGSGYRLICLREKVGLCFVFVGTHDACDRWLDKRRATSLSLEPEQMNPVENHHTQSVKPDLPNELLDAEKEYEQYIASKLDEETLNHLFSGFRKKYK